MLTVVNINFTNDSDTKIAIKKLRADLDFGRFEYFPDAPLTSRDDIDYEGEVYLDSNSVEKKGKSIRIEAFDAPLSTFASCIESFYNLGATSTCILECIDDERARSSYYIQTKEVSQLDYYRNLFGSALLTVDFIEKTFIVDQRQNVSAILKHFKVERTETAFCFLKFEAPDGKHFIYRGHDDLEKMANGSYDPKISFSTNFELSKFGGKLQSFAIHPTQIKFKKRKLEKVPKFKGQDRGLYKAVNGRFFDQYIVDYQADIQEALLSLKPGSFCDVPFEEILGFIVLTLDCGRFTAFGLDVYSYNYESDYFFKISGGGSWLDADLDVARIAQHLNEHSVNIDKLTDESVRAVWLSGTTKIGLDVGSRGFRIMITKEHTDHNRLRFH